ncbi:hypothetical protein KUCAC02_036051 [Chaenocephalus aceratus]|nr:hypothetical protein KUCAC02_036051 [Chaenocephalus aceratus]
MRGETRGGEVGEKRSREGGSDEDDDVVEGRVNEGNDDVESMEGESVESLEHGGEWRGKKRIKGIEKEEGEADVRGGEGWGDTMENEEEEEEMRKREEELLRVRTLKHRMEEIELEERKRENEVVVREEEKEGDKEGQLEEEEGDKEGQSEADEEEGDKEGQSDEDLTLRDVWESADSEREVSGDEVQEERRRVGKDLWFEERLKDVKGGGKKKKEELRVRNTRNGKK